MWKGLSMIKEYNRKSFYFGIPGIILQIAGQLMRDSTGGITSLGLVISLAGTALLITGLVFYAKAKGRHPAWCLMAFLSIIGLIVLACLKDKSEIKI
jgi:uncharacterized membrane protein